MKKKTEEIALEELKKAKEKHTKMENLVYDKLELQNYLKNEKIRVKQARIIFRFRTRMARCWGNFRGGRPPQICPVCKDDQSTDTQTHLFECRIVKENIKLSGDYKMIFSKQVDDEIATTLENIEKCREIYSDQ